MRACEACGESVTGRAEKRFCSAVCRCRVKRAREAATGVRRGAERPCATCGTIFRYPVRPGGNRGIYCSRRCAQGGDIRSRMKAKTQVGDGLDACWLWQGRPKGGGYGSIYFEGVNWAAHRLAWVLAVGELPQGKVVCHRCDNRLCVNPAHLWLGDPKDNMVDRNAKGRQARGERAGRAKLSNEVVMRLRTASPAEVRGIRRNLNVTRQVVLAAITGRSWKHLPAQRAVARHAGEAHHAAKLSWAAVEAIRASDLSLRALAREHGVSTGTVSAVRRGKTWRRD